MSARIFLVVDRKGLQNNQTKKMLQSNQDKKISLDKKLSTDNKILNLIGKYSKYTKSKCKTVNLVKKDWTNLDKPNLAKFRLARLDKLALNTCF